MLNCSMLNDLKNLEKEVAEILDVSEKDINDSFIFDNSSIDSLSMLTLLSMIDQLYSVNLTADDVIESKNIFGLKKKLTQKSI